MLRRSLLLLAVGHLLVFLALVAALEALGALNGESLAISAVSLGAALAVGSAVVALLAWSLRRLTGALAGLGEGGPARPLPVPSLPGAGELGRALSRLTQRMDELAAAAARERSRLQAALNSSGDAVVAVDGEGRIAFANLAAQRLFMRSREELVGNPFVWALPDEEVVQALRTARREGQRGTRLVRRPNQQYLQIITSPIAEGGEWAALVVLRDLTEVKRTEQVRRDFIANVSHELRTPLASLKAVIETLQTGALEDPAAARRFLASADAEVDRLVQMVEELLELSRIESGAVPLAQEPVEMGQVLRAAVERLRRQAERKGLSLTLEVPPDLPAVTGDAERLERVAVNLIHNAIKFTPTGGSVHVSAASEGGAVTVRVRDTGVGIAPEELPRIFERFYKADRSRGGGGAGLGLAVVRHTVEAHGGNVAVESQPGQGSTFSFSIPVSPLPLQD